MSILIKNTHIIMPYGSKSITGSIGIEGGIIKFVGEVPEGFEWDTLIDGGNFAAMPGLVNAHTHSPLGVMRNMADDLPFDKWLFDTIIPAEGKLTEEDIYWGAYLGIIEMIKGGTTCFADMYLHMDSIAKAVSETGIRANLSFGPITSAVRGDGLIVDDKRCTSFMSKWNGSENARITTYMEIHSVYLFDKHSITNAAALAKELGTGIHIHLSESEAELGMSMEKYGKTPVEAAYDMGVFDVPVIAAHCVKLTDNDIDILKSCGVSAVHNPSSNLKLGNGFAPIPRLHKEGIRTALGTDGAASNNNLNMFEEMRLAALIHKGASGDPECVSAQKVIEMATSSGAKALGFSGVGEIKEGNRADIILVNINKPHICPVNRIEPAIVYSARADDVDTVIVDGEILMKGGKLTSIDQELVMAKAKEIGLKL